MGKKSHVENWRVVVEPESLGNFGFASMADTAVEPDAGRRNERYRSLCEGLVREIKRHIDGVGQVYVDCDQYDVCEHCGDRWSRDSRELYNGGCCEKDQEAEDARVTEAPTLAPAK